MRRHAKKLPGQDSNLDKESQKVLQPRRKMHSDNSLGNVQIPFAPGLRVTPNSPSFDPDLAKLVDAWPSLPEALKTGILAMIDSARR